MPFNVILRTEYGSRAMGTHTEFSDHDQMGIYVEPIESVLGIDHDNTVQWSTAPKGERSGKDDTDTTYYPLRKWATLAARGNPTVLTPLFVRLDSIDLETSSGSLLREARDLFISKEAGHRFLGYMRGQRDAMTGQRNKRTNRPELIHQYGYDTKFAYHMIRTGLQGIELMLTGKIQLPMGQWEIEQLSKIRSGEYDKQEVLDWSEHLEIEFDLAFGISDLPRLPDVATINKLLIDIQTYEWGHA